MLSDDAIENLMQPIIERQEALNRYVVELIAKRVKEVGEVSPSDVHRLESILKMGGDAAKINAEIARITGLNVLAIKKLIKTVAEGAYVDAKPFYDYRHKSYIPFEKNLQLQNVVKAVQKQTLDTYKNLSNSTAFMIRDLKNPSVLKPTKLSKAYQSVIDEAIQATQSGTIDYNTAMRRTMKQLNDSGIRYVTYSPESGRIYTQRLDTAVRRNILDGVRQLNQGVQDEVGKQFGSDGKEISVHAFSAPDHEPVQGHQFTNAEYDKLQNAESFTDYKGNRFDAIKRHIGFWNCHHFTFSILLGVTKPNYTDEQLEKLKENNQKGVTLPNGKHLTMYEVTQKMRELETAIRRCKDGVLMAKESGDKELEMQYKQKMKRYRNDYKYLVNLAGLKERTDKMRVSGYHS